MATTSSTPPWTYDVFVSFRGEDIRKSFVDHLFDDFNQKGIYAFRDDNELPRGEEISPQLYKAIEESRFLIVIFSKNYAFSSWCLRELVKILECKQIGQPKHEVRIVFYDVKPDVVRKQTESYADALAKHEFSNKTEVAKWKKALSMAANLSGWDLQDMANGYESKFIDSISKEILKKLCDGPLHDGENLVGVDIRLQKLNLLRFIGSDKVNMIGICGISGIGKTTLAKAIYNLMYIHFEGSCFCEDVQGVTKRQGLTQVQMQLIDKIMKTRDVKISSISEGSTVIKRGMESKRILLVLDDVDHRDQLQALAGSPNWFCQGSLIIFTGKDKQLLNSHRLDEIHDMDFLDEDESLKLFSSYAFQEKHPTEDFKDLAEKVVKYLQGHPLALIVNGPLLYGKPVSVWKSHLDRLQRYPNAEIQQKLRPSFDGLDSDQKRIFLDIACSFIGEKKDFAASVLDSSDCFAETNIEVLVDKLLITISPSDMSLQMHELIQSMAREIVREESNKPGNQRRLWGPSEVYDVLREKNVIETQAVEVLVLMLKKSGQKVHIDAKVFSHMKKLRILKIYHREDFEPASILKDLSVSFSGSLNFLSNQLRLFYWHGYPFKFLPSDFYPENIVAIDLSYSHIKHLWTKPKCFPRLKSIKLKHCRNLTRTPDFTEITYLEELILEGCVNLVKLHPSIGMLKRLVVMDLSYSHIKHLWTKPKCFPRLKSMKLNHCRDLTSTPDFTEITNLEELILEGCVNLVKLHPSIGMLKRLVVLNINRTAITELPSFVFSLKNLESLSFGRDERTQCRSGWWTSISRFFGIASKQQHPQSLALSSLAGLHSLRGLNLSYRDILEVPDSIGSLSCLESLNLEGNNFTSLPGSLSQLSRLFFLRLNGCKKLEVLPELPPRLYELDADDCTSLRELPGLFNHPGKVHCYISHCPIMLRNVSIDSQESLSPTRLVDSSTTSHGSRNQFSYLLRFMSILINKSGIFRDHYWRNKLGRNKLDICFYGNGNIPQWFTNRSMGNHLKVALPTDWCYNKCTGYVICAVFSPNKPSHILCYGRQCFVNNFDGASLENVTDGFFPVRESDLIWFRYSKLNKRRWKEAKNFVTFSFGDIDDRFEVKECGVRLVFEEDVQQETDLFQVLPTPTPDGGCFWLHTQNDNIEFRW